LNDESSDPHVLFGLQVWHTRPATCCVSMVQVTAPDPPVPLVDPELVPAVPVDELDGDATSARAEGAKVNAAATNESNTKERVLMRPPHRARR
jgi:hypothetical protein